MDGPRFARQFEPGTANQTDSGDLPRRSTTEPQDDDLEEIKSTVLAKLALDLGKDASVATERDWFVAAALAMWLGVKREDLLKDKKPKYDPTDPNAGAEV